MSLPSQVYLLSIDYYTISILIINEYCISFSGRAKALPEKCVLLLLLSRREAHSSLFVYEDVRLALDKLCDILGTSLTLKVGLNLFSDDLEDAAVVVCDLGR